MERFDEVTKAYKKLKASIFFDKTQLEKYCKAGIMKNAKFLDELTVYKDRKPYSLLSVRF